MPKNKRPVPRKIAPSPEEKDDALTQSLCNMALELVEQEDGESMADALKQKAIDFDKLIKKCLNQKKDDILYESLERARDADSGAWQFLKDNIEEAAGTIVFKRDEGKALEVNAFVIPFFTWSVGGLNAANCFQDQEAFDALSKSIQDAQLESRDATVVLVNHAYHLDEIDSVAYSHLNQMVRDAFASMTDKKIAATPAIERSIAGWPESQFGAGDVAVELRFLLGFAMKSTDDAFYQVPEDESAADAYFDQRSTRFQAWTERVAPIIKRCLNSSDAEMDVKFLYQDLFHGGKERGMAEYFLLQMMAELNRAIEGSGVPPAKLKAVIAPVVVAGSSMLRVNLYAADDALVASADKPSLAMAEIGPELDDVCDALTTMGIESLAVASGFDEAGRAIEARPFRDST